MMSTIFLASPSDSMGPVNSMALPVLIFSFLIKDEVRSKRSLAPLKGSLKLSYTWMCLMPLYIKVSTPEYIKP